MRVDHVATLHLYTLKMRNVYENSRFFAAHARNLFSTQ